MTDVAGAFDERIVPDGLDQPLIARNVGIMALAAVDRIAGPTEMGGTKVLVVAVVA
jgi:hypothetical protein